MSSFILSTVGASLIENLGLSNSSKLPPVESIIAKLNELNPLNPEDFRLSGAEINSLTSLIQRRRTSAGDLTEPYYLAFLVSDTQEGEWMGRVLKGYFGSRKRSYRVEEVEVVKVKGLQDDDPKRFASEGLRNLVKQACKLLVEHRDEEVRVINATGGYKAQVSFTGLIGQMVGVPVVYMFEKFGYCIEMPPLPVDFSRDLWLEHYDLFKIMSEEGGYLTDDPTLGNADHRFVDLLDRMEENGKYLFALSPILELMHQSFLIRRWPADVKEPSPSKKSPQEKASINEDHMPHAPRGTREFIERLCQKDWIDRVSTVEFVNTSRSHIITKKDRDKLEEIWLIWSDGNLGCRISVITTARNDGEREWCMRTLNDYLNSGG